MKAIVLCADDYGQEENISKGIIDLIDQKRISATSCLVTHAAWLEQGRWLKPYEKDLDIGLHLNLTEGVPLSNQYRKVYGETFKSLKSVLFNAFLNRFNLEIIISEFEAQLNQFIKITGFLPHFVDGHQHIHQFWHIQKAVIQLFLRHFDKRQHYLRLVRGTTRPTEGGLFLKKWVIFNTGAKVFAESLNKDSLLHNTSFSGIYPFDTKKSYRCYFLTFLESINRNGLIMCHPSKAYSLKDPISKSRIKEFDYLKSSLFLNDLNNYGIVLKRFSQTL